MPNTAAVLITRRKRDFKEQLVFRRMEEAYFPGFLLLNTTARNHGRYV